MRMSGLPSSSTSATSTAFEVPVTGMRSLASLKRPVPSFRYSSLVSSSSLTMMMSRSPSPSKSAMPTSSLSCSVRGSRSLPSLKWPVPSFSSRMLGRNSLAITMSRSPSASMSAERASMLSPSSTPAGRCVAETSRYSGSASLTGPGSASPRGCVCAPLQPMAVSVASSGSSPAARITRGGGSGARRPPRPRRPCSGSPGRGFRERHRRSR